MKGVTDYLMFFVLCIHLFLGLYSSMSLGNKIYKSLVWSLISYRYTVCLHRLMTQKSFIKLFVTEEEGQGGSEQWK